MTSSSRPMPSVRQPVSCEPCRRRKIKCSRTRPPCDTCQRRGLAENCVYLGSRESPASSNSNDELLRRINNLEALLRKQTSAGHENNSPTSLLSPPLDETERGLHQSPQSLASEDLITQVSSPANQPTRSTGTLVTSLDGNIRYEPSLSGWNSVLANTTLSATQRLLTSEDDVVDRGFPFTSEPVPSYDDLLSLLPPVQQCNYLKDKYFAVFSPVSFTRVYPEAQILG